MIAIPVHIFQNTLIGASLAALVCSLIGVFVVRMKLSSMGFCMSHAAFAGAALGLAISKDPLLMALGLSTLVALVLFEKEFLAIMLDRKLAEESGINTRPFYYAILFL